MTITQTLGALLPPRYRAAARYWLRRSTGRLDPELPALCDAVRPGSLALDVGANTGVFSYALSRAGAVVQAFEPQPHLYQLLEATHRAIPRIVPHAVALSDHSGDAVISVPLRDGRPEYGEATFGEVEHASATYHVPVRTLDSFGFRDVSVVKIDVEGHESAVLRGGVETIRREHPVLLVEIEVRHIGATPITDVFALIEDLGYRGHFRDVGGAMKPLTAFSPSTNQRLEDFGTPRYHNNFLFLPR